MVPHERATQGSFLRYFIVDSDPVPGSEQRKLDASLRSKADSIVFDLEDGVALSKKQDARQRVANALASFDMGTRDKCVRINAVGSGLETEDLNAILPCPQLSTLLIPKVHSASEIKTVTRMIDLIVPESRRSNIRILASIESAMGLLNIREIATADARIEGLVFAAEDYCADTSLIRTPSRLELLYARQKVVAVASAFGLQSIDLVCVDYKNPEILKEECKEGRTFGFTGKQAIHPNQVDLIQSFFCPSDNEIALANRIIQGYKENLQKGIGAFTVDGKMVDMPVVKWAQRLLARASVSR